VYDLIGLRKQVKINSLSNQI